MYAGLEVVVKLQDPVTTHLNPLPSIPVVFEIEYVVPVAPDILLQILPLI
jgi:hypothetical protein